ncbi:MAG: hypothetical protein ACYC5H_12035 [Methylovirgula sp.]
MSKNRKVDQLFWNMLKCSPDVEHELWCCPNAVDAPIADRWNWRDNPRQTGLKIPKSITIVETFDFAVSIMTLD